MKVTRNIRDKSRKDEDRFSRGAQIDDALGTKVARGLRLGPVDSFCASSRHFRL